jgi:hypothetical protein
MNRSIFSFATFATLALTLVGCGAEMPVASTQINIAGRWVSSVCEAYPGAGGTTTYLRRDFTITATRWQLNLDVYGDAACSAGLFSARIEGPYTLGMRSATVAGATEGEFASVTNVWTAHMSSLAQTFTMSGCGSAPWQVGVAQDVHTTGCIGVAQPAAMCAAERDLVSIDTAGRLHFGRRDVNLCMTRPMGLNDYGLTRR